MKALYGFRYSGSKRSLLKHYLPPPTGTRRVVEPFIGGGAYTLNSSLPGLGYDADRRVVDLWRWLQQTTEEELRALDAMLRSLPAKVVVRTLDLPEGAVLYLKINVFGLIVGQWSSWSTYPQHRLPVEATLKALPRIRQIEVKEADYRKVELKPNDMLFVDPPYVGTEGNYKKGLAVEVQELTEALLTWKQPTIFTYGTGAPALFPRFKWQKVREKKVPCVRRGGSVFREEFVAYLNWPT